MAPAKRGLETFSVAGEGKWKGWKVRSRKRGGYLIVNLTRPKDTPIYSIMSSPNVIRFAFKQRK